MKTIWMVSSCEVEREEWVNGARIRKHNCYVQNKQRDAKNSVGKGEAKELLCMTHIHELSRRDCYRDGEYWEDGSKG